MDGLNLSLNGAKPTIALLTIEMMIPEIPGFFRGGLGDLQGHVPEGMRGICKAIPITYGYPIHWQTGEPINYHHLPGAQFLFNLDVDMYWPSVKRTVPVFSIDRGGVQTYLVCPARGMLSSPQGDILYPTDTTVALEQSAFYGRAAEALLMHLGKKPDIVWSQEWRAACTAMPSMMANPYFADAMHLYTSHTCRAEALPKFPAEWFDALSIDRRYYESFVIGDRIDPDRGCIVLSDMTNGVSTEHGEVLRAMHPDQAHKIRGVMNGVSRAFALSRRIKAFSDDPTPNQLFYAHLGDKSELINFVNKEAGTSWNTTDFVVGLTRRLARYKNQYWMFKDIVSSLVRSGMKVVVGGLPHESDEECNFWASEFERWTRDPELAGRFVYIRKYSEEFRRLTAQGCDVWVECPWKRSEACGTGIFFAWMNGNLVVATQGGGAKEHGTIINPDTGEGDALFIEPYEPQMLKAQLERMHGWYKACIKDGNDLWLRLRMNAFQGGKKLDVAQMMERYDERCFRPLLAQAAARKRGEEAQEGRLKLVTAA